MEFVCSVKLLVFMVILHRVALFGGFQWNFFPASHWPGALNGFSSSTKATARWGELVLLTKVAFVLRKWRCSPAPKKGVTSLPVAKSLVFILNSF